MKILYFHQYYSTPEGSTGLRSYYMANALAREGHEIVVITGNYDRAHTPCHSNGGVNSASDGKITVVCLPIAASNKDGFLRRIATFVWYALWAFVVGLKHPADLILATSTPLTAAIPAIILKKIMQVPFIFEARDLWPDAAIELGELTNPVLKRSARWLEKHAYQQADSCIALAPGIVSAMRKRGGKDIHFISNGAPLDSSKQINISGTPGSKPSCAIYTGTLGRANNALFLTELSRQLIRKDRSDIIISVFGDGSEKKKLYEIKHKHSLTNLQLYEPVKRSNLKNFYSGAFAGLLVMQDIKVFRHSTSPNKFFDYLGAGLPVVCSYEGWIAKLIKEYNCGLVVNNQDPGDFAEALIRLHDNREERRQMSQNALALITAKFDIKKLQQQFVSVVNQYE